MGLIVGAGVAVAGGIMGANAAKSAASAQADAINNALQFQQQVYGNTQQNLNPFIGAGTNALGALQQLYGLAPAGTGGGGNALQSYQNFTQTPFYQFPLSQGISALNRSGAASGLTLSGGQLNSLQKYGQGYASQNFNSYINALSGLANLGEGAAGTLGGQGNQAAQTTLTGQTALGNAQASGIIGAQNQINNALSAIPGLLGGTGNGSSYGSGAGGSGGLLGNALSSLFTGASLGNGSSFAQTPGAAGFSASPSGQLFNNGGVF
jgi:hypothetical protein